MIWPLFRYILMAAWRDRFFVSVAGILAAVVCLSVFFGASVLTEQSQFARTFCAFGFRLFGITTLILFVISYLRRSFESRDIDYLLSRPIGRVKFILTHSASFSFLGLITAFILGGTVVALETPNIHSGVLLWWASLAVEFVIMANVAMFFAFVMRSPTACTIVVFTFYVLSRLIGEILGILNKSSDTPVIAALSKVMELISIFVPRLDLMGQTKWILYGVPPELSFGFIVGQGAVFVAVVIGATLLDMQRRQF